MAMLAEPKRRQKYGNDPRNTLWSNDESKFGFRMLESMGWKKGKGLGANESGMTDHIKTVHRNTSDVRGVGCSKSHADNWIAHQDDFNSLLTSLNEDSAAGTSTDSATNSTTVNLEEKSKSSKSRVHYHKFTRSKDLSRRSSTDLDCIFGKRKTSSITSTPPIQSENNSDEDSCEGRPSFKQEDNNSSTCDSNTTLHGIKTITSSSSVQEYFAMKMAELKQKREGATSDSVKHESSDASGQSQTSREGSDVGSTMVDGGAEVNEESVSQAGKKKKRKKSKRPGEDSEEDCPQEGNKSAKVLLEGQADADEDQVKSKSKKKDRKNKGDVSEKDNDLNDSCTPPNTTSSEKKNGREEADTKAELQIGDAETTEESRVRVGKKKKKKSKKSGDDSEEEAAVVPLEDQAISKNAGGEHEKSKPKKKGRKDRDIARKMDYDLNDNCLPTKHSSEEEPCDSDRGGKQKKKSKKQMHAETSLSDEEKSADKKSEKTSEKSGSVEQAESAVSQTCDNDNSNLVSKKSKKKKRTKKSDEKETSVNTSILRCKNDRKRRRTKSVSFSVGGDEIFMIPAKEDSGHADSFEAEKEEEADEEEKPFKSRTKKRKRGRVELDNDEEKMNIEEEPCMSKTTKRKREKTESDEESTSKKKKKSAKQEEKSIRKKKKKSIKVEEDSSDDEMSKENSQAQQACSGKGSENVPAKKKPSKKERESKGSAEVKETTSKQTELENDEVLGNADGGPLLSRSCLEGDKKSKRASPNVSKVCETFSKMSESEESANPKDRQAGLHNVSQTVSPVQQVFPGKGKGEEKFGKACASTIQRKSVEETRQNASIDDTEKLSHDVHTDLEEKCKAFTGANLASIKGYGC